MKSKYIIFEVNGLDIPVVFSPLLQHKEVARGLNKPVLSAGFCHIENGHWACYGESISLGVKAKASDNEVLNKYLAYSI